MANLVVENDKQFNGVAIYVDGMAFSRCTFTCCNVHYAGGYFGAVDCKWDRCIFHFSNAAARTAAFLNAIDYIKDDRPLVLQNTPQIKN